ncbi:hypothetical protein [Rhodospirillum sp. A1_3_36]|uniref:hypothetical protein n=1 Tax=Rhodospirillum sp. A1_3_36 TaxID=3391666 RepID=UPI0039A4A5B1
MPSIICRCGNRLRFGVIPNSLEWLIISDSDYEKIEGNIDSEELYMKFKSIIKCDNCRKIWIYWNGFQDEPVCYKEDNYLEEGEK